MSSIRSLLGTLWQRKLSVILGGFVGLLLGGGYLAMTPPKYSSTMLIAAANHGLSSLSEGANRGLSVAGSLFGTAQNPDFTRILALLHSEVVASSLQSKYQVIQRLHPQVWDGETKQWRRPSDFISEVSQRLNALFHRPEWQPPGPEALAQELSKGIRIEQTDNKGVYMVTFTANTPDLAHDVLEEAYSEADYAARTDALKVASVYVAYLENELKLASNDETRRGLTDLYLQQEQRKMILSADVPFAADVISGPTTPRRPSGLSPSIVLMIGILVGAAAFFFISIYRTSRGEENAFEEVSIAAQ